MGRSFPSGSLRKPRPGIRLQSGTHFPVELVWEAVSQNQAPKWDRLSRRAPSGKYIPESSLRMGCTFPLSLFGKLRPGIGSQSGTRFPVEASSGKCIPFLSLKAGRAFSLDTLWETTSRNQAPEWDALSQMAPHREIASQNLSLEWDALSLWVHFGKLHPSSSVCP